uniref:Uncharacterized protein n=1 Tax=Rhizophora mucronata TaxID=61149 RepID=A0A2P2P2T1_RHIMU
MHIYIYSNKSIQKLCFDKKLNHRTSISVQNFRLRLCKGAEITRVA